MFDLSSVRPWDVVIRASLGSANCVTRKYWTGKLEWGTWCWWKHHLLRSLRACATRCQSNLRYSVHSFENTQCHPQDFCSFPWKYSISGGSGGSRAQVLVQWNSLAPALRRSPTSRWRAVFWQWSAKKYNTMQRWLRKLAGMHMRSIKHKITATLFVLTFGIRVFSASLIGIISWGTTGRILVPPCSSKFFTPSYAKMSYGCSTSRKPLKKMGR